MAAKAAETRIDDEPIQPLEKLTEALLNAGVGLGESSEIPEKPPTLTKAPGPVVARTQALYNSLDMARVAAIDRIRDIEAQLAEEDRDLQDMVDSLTLVTNRRKRQLMAQRQDAANEMNAAQLTMKTLTGG